MFRLKVGGYLADIPSGRSLSITSHPFGRHRPEPEGTNRCKTGDSLSLRQKLG